MARRAGGSTRYRREGGILVANPLQLEKLRTLAREPAREAWDYGRRRLPAQTHATSWRPGR